MPLKGHNSENKNITATNSDIMMMMIRHEKRAYKNMATENGVYNTNSTI